MSSLDCCSCSSSYSLASIEAAPGRTSFVLGRVTTQSAGDREEPACIALSATRKCPSVRGSMCCKYSLANAALSVHSGLCGRLSECSCAL